jgi:hypothetical protein
LTLSLYQLLFICLTNNDPYNGYPFTGLLFVLALLFVDDVERSSRKSFGETVNRLSTPKSSAVLRVSLVLVALVAGAHLLQEGWRFTFSRVVHDTLDDADYSPAVYSHALRPVQWGIPTMASWRKRQEVTAQSVDDLSAYLKQMEGDFFIFPDFTVLYGISGKTPPQPLLWFHRGLTYPMVYSESLDARIIESLKKNQIECVVLETESYLGTQNRLGDFPLLREYIESWFVPTRRIVIFQILRRRNQDERGESSWSPSWQRNPAACETSIRSTRTTRSRMSVAPRIQFLGAPSSGAQTDNRQCLKARGDPEEISIW